MKLVLRLTFTLSIAAQDRRSMSISCHLHSSDITDPKGRHIDALQSAEFVLLDNGRTVEANVDSFATGVAPVALVVAVRSSGISAGALLKVQKIGSMVQPLITGQRGCAALVSFAERIERLQECTRDQDVLARAFAKLAPREGRTARRLDAVHQAAKRLRARRSVRRVLLLVSESRDRGSETDLEAAALAAEAAGISVYAATYSVFKTAFTTRPSEVDRLPKPKGPPDPTKRPSESAHSRTSNTIADQRVDLLAGIGELTRLRRANPTQVLASRSGRAVFAFSRQKGLEDAIEKLGTELHSPISAQLRAGHAPAGLHRVEVRVTRRGEFRVRARPGYWSPQ